MTLPIPLIDEDFVRELLREQHPDLGEETIRLLGIGWDNVIYRLGTDYVLRLPRRKEAVPLIEHERTWLPVLADGLPIPIPVPVRGGRPSRMYPWPWSVVPWLPGETADIVAPATDQAQPLAEFLRALHQPAPTNAPKNLLRGVPLRQRAKIIKERLERWHNVAGVNYSKLLSVLTAAIDAPRHKEPCWLHGDLHALNVLVSAGKITGIIDWGDITSGDVATDIAAIWMLFRESETRNACLEYYQPRADLLTRAKGWALHFGTVFLEIGLAEDPKYTAIGEATLQRLTEDV